MVVPVIINQNNSQSQSNNGAIDMGAGFTQNQLRDMIQQAVSTQLQLFQMRGDNTRQSALTNRSLDSIKTTQTMRDEEIKLRCEQQLLNKQIPINVHP